MTNKELRDATRAYLLVFGLNCSVHIFRDIVRGWVDVPREALPIIAHTLSNMGYFVNHYDVRISCRTVFFSLESDPEYKFVEFAPYTYPKP